MNIPLGRDIKWPNTFELLLEKARHQWQQRRLGCSTVRQFSLDENFQTPFIHSTPVSYRVAGEAVFAINTWCHHRRVPEAQVLSCPCHQCATMPKHTMKTLHRRRNNSACLWYDIRDTGLVETHLWGVSPSNRPILYRGTYITYSSQENTSICGI